MIYLTYYDKVFEFTDQILQISSYLNNISKDRKDESEPLPLLSCSPLVFKIFGDWFETLVLKGIVKFKIDFATVIFNPEFFEKYDVKTLIDVFNFGFANQIRMLCETVAYALGIKSKITKYEDNYMIATNVLKFSDRCYFEFYFLHESLAIMILKNLSDYDFEKTNIELKNNNIRKPVIPYTNYINEITPDDIFDSSDKLYGKYIIIPYSYTDIEDFAKENFIFTTVDIRGQFDLMENVEIPNTVTRIGNNNFNNCNIENIVIPNSVKTIGNNNFKDCSILTNIEILNPDIKIGYCNFVGCPNLNFSFNNTLFKVQEDLIEFSIYDNITEIREYAFAYCKNLTNLVLPSSVVKIGWDAFNSCEKLNAIHNNILLKTPVNVENYNIPDGIKEIKSCAFSEHTNLKNLVIPSSVEIIGKESFYYCTKLTNLSLPSVKYINDAAFKFCKLINIKLPNTLKHIGKEAFMYCYELKHIDIPTSVTKIGEKAFSYAGLENITIPSSVTRIKSGTFYHCTLLTSVKLPDTLKSINGSAFYNCLALEDINIPNSVTNIDKKAFTKTNLKYPIRKHLTDSFKLQKF